MEEQLITFETAKLAKEKGFKLPLRSNRNYYNLNGNIHPYNWFNQFELADYTDAPTQSLLQKWLREKHDIHIEINSFSDVSTYDGYLIYNTAPYDYNDPNAIPDAKNCKTYEKALEICLYKGIKLIK